MTILPCLKLSYSEFLATENTNNPPTQNQQISKSTVYSCCTRKYSTRGGGEWQIQHEAKPSAVFATRPHPSCCIRLVLYLPLAPTPRAVCICYSTTASDVQIIQHEGWGRVVNTAQGVAECCIYHETPP